MAEERPTPEMPESLRNGVYANFFSVSIGENEAVLDFGFISPKPQSGPSGEPVPARNEIVSRVIVSRNGIEKLRDLVDGLLKGPS